MSIILTNEGIQLKPAIKVKYFIPKEPPQIKESFLESFFVGANVIAGTRYYSESVIDINEAYNLFYLYAEVVKYFGGGKVYLYSIGLDGYDIIDSKSV